MKIHITKNSVYLDACYARLRRASEAHALRPGYRTAGAIAALESAHDALALHHKETRDAPFTGLVLDWIHACEKALRTPAWEK